MEGLQRFRNGDVTPITRIVTRNIDRVAEHLEDETDRTNGRDIAVVAGMALSMLGIRALKILPSLPFAPGHKLVLLTPLYVVATYLTKRRSGATMTGLSMGAVSFLMGDGKYGVFEVLKHTAPGIICDLVLPPFLAGGRMPGPVFWTAIGGLIAIGRFGTIFVIVLVVQAPAVAWAIFAPGLVIHTTFGLLSGFVTWHLLRGMGSFRDHLVELEGEQT